MSRTGRPTTARCGTEGGYYRHVRKGLPFPEDSGGISCGCRAAHAKESSARDKRARARRRAERAALKAKMTTCPDCGGTKSTKAARCRKCQRGRPLGMRAEHGSETGYQYHVRHGEIACAACLTAHNEFTRLHARPRTGSSNEPKHPCATCGKPVTAKSRRCRSCASKEAAEHRRNRELVFTAGWVQRGGVWRAAS